MGLGLLAAGALAGWLTVSAVGGSTEPQATAANAPAAANGGTGALPGGPAGGPGPGGDTGGDPGSGTGVPNGVPHGFRSGGGGLAGEQRLQGTLSAVGNGSVTVRTPAGTATYAITAATQILRDGSPATLADLKVGEPVFLHVYPASRGGSLAVERIFAGSLPSFGGGAPGLPPGGRDDDGDNGQGQQGQEQGTTT